ncbi:hypothetical protein BJV82DRAFT_656147 [Fennellomyces sp. T-0311]|nr:hypothetical protein BJV82DRAFT_656147 [Fennellomyces sp. T-0311]
MRAPFVSLLPLVYYINAVAAQTKYATNIKDCPTFPHRERPSNIYNLRADDIKVIAAIGDSLSAGVAARNVNTTYVSAEQFNEYRGISFDIGGDKGAVTLPNMINHYIAPETLIGPSLGVRKMETCPETFFCLDAKETESNNLNAALPAATSMNFTEELEYLIPKIGKTSPLANEWKVLSIFLGQNDLSVSCFPGYTIFDFATRMKAGLTLLEENVDNVYVNLVGLIHSEEVTDITNAHPNYRKQFRDGFDVQQKECYCCHVLGGLGKTVIGLNVPSFNLVLKGLADTFAPKGPDATFGVFYQPLNVELSSVPYTAFSNLDGFHLNENGHQFFAKFLWNKMHMSSEEKQVPVKYDENYPVVCPTPDMGFATD